MDDFGRPTSVWSDWFKKVFARVGGHIALTNTELESVTTARIVDDAVTFPKLQNITTDRLVGRDTAATGDPEEIAVSGGLEFTGTGGIQTSAFTGDVTKPAGSAAQTIASGAVSFAKMLSTDWTSSKTTSGYTKLPNGIVIQWGTVTALSLGTNTTAGFPLTFPTACLQVIAGVMNNSIAATTTTGQWGTGAYTTTGFGLYNRTNLNLDFNWIAVGY